MVSLFNHTALRVKLPFVPSASVMVCPSTFDGSKLLVSSLETVSTTFVSAYTSQPAKV